MDVISNAIGLEIVTTSGIEDMRKTISRLERSENMDDRDFRQILKKMPTPKEYLEAWVLGQENDLSLALRPERLDVRYENLRQARARLRASEIEMCISIYEDLQKTLWSLEGRPINGTSVSLSDLALKVFHTCRH